MNLVLALPDDRFLPLFGAAAVLCSLLGFWVRSRFLSPRDPPQEQHLDLQPMPLAYLAGGARRMRCVGVALLWQRGAIAFFDTDVLGDDAHDLKSALTLPTQPFLTITTESEGFEDDDS